MFSRTTHGYNVTALTNALGAVNTDAQPQKPRHPHAVGWSARMQRENQPFFQRLGFRLLGGVARSDLYLASASTRAF